MRVGHKTNLLYRPKTQINVGRHWLYIKSAWRVSRKTTSVPHSLKPELLGKDNGLLVTTTLLHCF